ncbi:LytR C-terminal domain-containing protein [Segeticoccus rhizosphaerae]|uniref:LytR C-terminal domain-containing protein n=1 Tax=Segeticoccus rhizosphaerae TaxID=1104777 RepID=UPI001264C955|nr:LytR C-terminal domain-containing protein [Segeticoccus rhizosphaerae]
MAEAGEFEEGPVPRRGRIRHGLTLVLVAALLGGGFYGAYNRVWGSEKKPVVQPACTPVTPTPPPTVKAGLVYVNVFNASDRAGLADETARLLEHRGFHVISVKNDPVPRSVQGVGEVRYGPNGATVANTIAAQVDGVKLVEDNRADPSVDLALGPKFQHLNPLPPARPGSFTLNVYNTTWKPGLAGDTAAALKKRGFRIGEVGNDPQKSFITTVGVLRFGEFGKPAAERVALQIKGLKLVEDNRKNSSVDLVLGTKFDSFVPKAQATVPPKPTPTPTRESRAGCTP